MHALYRGVLNSKKIGGKGGKARLHLLQENFEVRREYRGVQGSTEEYEGSMRGV